MSDEIGGVEGQLYDIDCTLMRAVDNLERIANALERMADRKSTRLNSSHVRTSRMPSSA